MASALGDMIKVIENELKCHSCGVGPRAGKSHQWYKCLSSHSTCMVCAIGAFKCKCGEALSKQYCKMTEELLKLKSMRFKCHNQSRGCQETMVEEAMISHETECIYRLIKCPRIDCKLKVPFHELLDHMKKNEPAKHLYKSYSILNGEKQKHESKLTLKIEEVGGHLPVYFDVNGRSFFSIVRVKEETFYQWIHFLGSPDDAKNYSYTLEYYGNNGASQRTNIYTNFVIPIDEPSHAVEKSFNCFTMSYQAMVNQFIEDGTFKYSVQIRNLKEEAKDDNEESGISDDE